MGDYEKFLAESILTEDKVITYRLLSRALKVHVNTAKQMLYDFHKTQIEKRPGAVHATYLIYGTRKPTENQPLARIEENGDIKMANSPAEMSLHEDIAPVSTLSLVREEQLNDALVEYEQVSSIHIYSVGPHPANDLALLSDTARQVLEHSFGDHSADVRKEYCVITNPYARHRERRDAGTRALLGVGKEESKRVSAAALKVKEEPTTAHSTNGTASSTQAKKAPLFKRADSGIMQAFTKAAAAKGKKAEAPQPSTTSGNESNMQSMSDDGEDDSEMSQPTVHQGGTHKDKKQREEELRKMMEDDEEEEEEEKGFGALEELSEEPPATEPTEEEGEPSEIMSPPVNGRRRGKRKIMKKKQIMDDQGYLVTIQEPGWESFSEDDAPPPEKPKLGSTAPAAPTVPKGKKSGTKSGGQGNIMSFFSKK